ncbi:MAG: DUF2200 domain-containing protein [Streptococcaceae bacterium]|jgi:hypothetical protein|nr:DUF2200 domain-containing protein [Streptococcaceae bacterium]
MARKQIHEYTFASIYPMYVQKIEKKGRTQAELIEVLSWLTGFSEGALMDQIEKQHTLEEFFKQALKLNENRNLIKGIICGVRVENIEDEMVQNIRYMDKLVDELAKGKAMEKILR